MTQLRDAQATSPYPRMTYEEYLHDPGIEERTEWVAGEVVPMMSVSRVHTELQMFLIELLQAHLRTKAIGRLYIDPFQMKLFGELPGRAPDIMFVRNEHIDRLQDLYLEGPADLVIEISSKGTESVDRGDKFLEYERGGVPEYWILDPLREIAQFYLRDEQGIYRAINVPEAGMFESPALEGFRLKVDWLWDRPRVGDVMDELGLR